MKQALFELADTLGLDVWFDPTAQRRPLSGSVQRDLHLMDGAVRLPLDVRVVDSGTYDMQGRVGVVVHVTGALYLVLISEKGLRPGDQTHLWVVNGAKLGWAPDTEITVFPATWNEAEIHNAFADGVVEYYTRGVGNSWTSRPRHTYTVVPVATTAAAPEFHTGGSLAHALSKVSDKFRTKGPRGV